ncbi:ATP-binding protein [Oceanobacillus bengalensis]|uniref:Magnesium chelatase ChlI-like catalytic domain-containing protein n=1 Tax=Oceanobacillus bengalensis TaxID=1435466 RepID=A0A494YSU5_9BACI|nr:ATP-binding protein [Oceanobacillus bengalensis]RKQ13187.1 hypothetical protein D8M05_16945 [Oceanobacillus bengalensis]
MFLCLDLLVVERVCFQKHFLLSGEVSLAHYWVLFLDEMAEFPKRTLDMLRQANGYRESYD